MTDADLLELEERGWQALSGPSPEAFCEQWLADDAVMIVPGMMIDRATFLQAVAHEQPWTSHTIRNAKVVQLTVDSAALIYGVTARRQGQPDFTGLLTSVYAIRDGRWRLVVHQQTPSPSN
ncbi:MAG: nuclear transport factor 2 family protein [Actinobacteria bacterium]|nr:nuclear transport factor 2 family protein [Actinomycetota bacterium]MBO0834120.1 nuclear transport factor 2 family protein [Actinomycetota bacterium]